MKTLQNKLWISGVVTCLALFSSLNAEAEEVVRFDDVMRSVEQHHPAIHAASARVARAEAKTLEADGIYDPKLLLEAKITTGAYYELRRFDSEIRQFTPLWGAEVYGGYRNALGVNSGEYYPTYYSDQTLAGGQLRAGIDVPLWRGGPTDARRTRVTQSEFLLDAANHEKSSIELKLRIEAASAYFAWHAAAQRLALTESVLQLAKKRQGFLVTQLNLGAVSEFEVQENYRMVVEREDRFIADRRQLEAAAIQLSLYLRKSSGEPLVAHREVAPPLLDNGFDLSSHVEPRVMNKIIACHPSIRKKMAELDSYRAEAKLADSLVAPDIKLNAQIASNQGDPTRNETLVGTVFTAGVKLEMPLLLRSDRGKAEAARASILEMEAELRWIRERIQSDLRDALSKLKAAEERYFKTAELAKTAEALAETERKRFLAGGGQLFVVNGREIAAADAELKRIDAAASWQASKAAWGLYQKIACTSPN